LAKSGNWRNIYIDFTSRPARANARRRGRGAPSPTPPTASRERSYHRARPRRTSLRTPRRRRRDGGVRPRLRAATSRFGFRFRNAIDRSDEPVGFTAMKPFARVNAPIKRLGASRSQTRAVEPIGALVGARFLTRRDVVGSLGATAVWTSRRGGRSSLPSRARVHAGFDDARTSDADANAKPRRRALTAHGHARDSDDDDAREGIASRPRRGGGRSVKNRSS